MANADTEVECPICGGTFDPTAAGGWCTNPDCGEWQYEADDEAEEGADDEDEAPADAGSNTADDFFEEADQLQSESDSDPVEEPVATAEADGEVDPEIDDSEEHAAVDAADDPGPTAETDSGADDGVDPADASDGEPAEAEDTDPEPESPAESAESEDTAQEPATISCPDCGTELDADANFCIECGADVQSLEPGDDELTECPSCGVDLEGDEHFCANCGEDLDAHRGAADGAAGTADEESDADAVEALEAQTDDEDAPVPESLVLSVLGKEIAVEDGDRVGREVRAALTDAGRSQDEAVRIHREHVRFVREADSFYLVDLGDNPTKLNGRSLQKGDREPVGPGDELGLSGVATITIEAP